MEVSDKTVRNLAKKFASYLEAKREARDAERLERALARTTRVQTWLDDTLDDDMRRLDELTKSWNDNVALQALRTKFAMTASLRIAAASGRAASSTVDDGELRSMIGNFNSGRSAS
jgi:hypothetical protein